MPAAGAPTPMAATPSPVTAAPAPMTPMPVAMPAHLFGLEAVDLIGGGDGGPDVWAAGREPRVFQRMRHQRRGLRRGAQRGRACGNPNGDFQEVTAFHVISL